MTDRKMTGQICLITGATSGLGLITSRELAQKGATVVMVARNPDKGRRVMEELRLLTGGTLDLLVGDLSSIAECRRVAAEFKSRYSRLDVLVNNAGAIFDQRQESIDHLEMTFALNHMGYFVLTLELLDLLKTSAPARIVNVSSDAHRGGIIPFDDLQLTRKFTSFAAYSNSKLANLLFTRELSRRLQGTGVTANSLHPGAVATHFGMEVKGAAAWVFKLVRPFMRTPDKGAQTTVYLASSPEVAGVSGKYFKDCKEISPARQALDDEGARRLWEVSEALSSPIISADVG